MPPLPKQGITGKWRSSMLVEELMTREVTTASPDETLRHTARRMAELDVGALPVGRMTAWSGSKPSNGAVNPSP